MRWVTTNHLHELTALPPELTVIEFLPMEKGVGPLEVPTQKYDATLLEKVRDLYWYRVWYPDELRIDWVAAHPYLRIIATNHLGAAFTKQRFGWGWFGTSTFLEEVDNAIALAKGRSVSVA